ncbi:MAG: ribose-5-phosphate isomerase RpiA [Alphaproteobacteria bacterium]
MSADEQKRLAGEAAAQLVEAGMTVGLGTGSTAAWFVKALVGRGLDIRGVPTSVATANLATSLGMKLATLDEVKGIDLTVDGADEIGPGLTLIKGGGAALLREKLVWEASKRCVVIADQAKVVSVLGAFSLPIEVVAFGHFHTQARLCDALASCDIDIAPRWRKKDGEPVRTDGGNYVYDADCREIADPAMLADALKLVTGVVEHGLFLDLADEAIIGTDDGVIRLSP